MDLHIKIINDSIQVLKSYKHLLCDWEKVELDHLKQNQILKVGAISEIDSKVTDEQFRERKHCTSYCISSDRCHGSLTTIIQK